jgi:hypothetical protein
MKNEKLKGERSRAVSTAATGALGERQGGMLALPRIRIFEFFIFHFSFFILSLPPVET